MQCFSADKIAAIFIGVLQCFKISSLSQCSWEMQDWQHKNMKFFVCLLEKYWVGSKVLVFFSFKIICHLCHCWIYRVIYLWLTRIIHVLYAFLHCSAIIYQICMEGNIKREEASVSVAVPCLSTPDHKQNLTIWGTYWAHANQFFVPCAVRGCWHLSVIEELVGRPWGWEWRRGRQVAGGLEIQQKAFKMKWKGWYGN